MNPTTTLLIVEDDERIRNYMKTILTTCDYAVLETGNARTALSIIASHSPDLVLLDLGLPDGDGIDMLRSIREWSQVPVIVVSARGHERDKVAALDGGADDYVTKPFGADTERHLVKVDGNPVHLTQTEYKIVLLLCRNSGKVLTYDAMIREVWGPFSGCDTQILRVNMANIRRKLEKDPAMPEYITTEIGVGYRIIELESENAAGGGA